MKQKYTMILLLVISLNSFGQMRFDVKGTVVSKSIPATNVNGANIQIGTNLRILEYGTYNSPDGARIPGYLVKVDQQTYAIKASHLDRIQLDEPANMYEQWDQILLLSELPESYAEYGYQYELRNDLEEEAQEMINIFYNQNLLFHDDYIEDYLQSLLNRVQPNTYNDLRPGHLNIKILSSAKPNSYSLPDGTIIVSTGLISVLNSEEELLAILTHEMAHYVLDHQITNYNAQVTREKRATFWAGVATGLAAAGEIYLNVSNDIYTGGVLTASTAALSTSIAQDVISRLGIEYSQKQEDQVDHASSLILKMLHIDSTALSSVLVKMNAYYLDQENYFDLSPNGPYPALLKRITSIGEPDPLQFQNTKYDQMVSLVHLHNALLHLNSKEPQSAIKLCDRNIEAGIAMEDDYIIKAIALRQMSENPAGNLEALRNLQTAESLDLLPNINVYKQQGITYLRLDMKNEALAAFTTYLQNLETIAPGAYVNSELRWSRAMIHKAGVLE
jgi:beta-barrel assembly-enhancing protease